MIRPLCILIALGGTAWASSWSSFEPAFPTNPCHDGWAACVVDGQPVDAEMRAQGGLPQPADLRVGWFDLEPTPAFSPFEGLSEYTGSAPEVAAADVDEDEGELPDDDGVAEAEMERSQESVEAERAADEAAMEEAAARAAEEEARRQAQEAERAREEAAAQAAQAAAEEEERRREAERLAAEAARAEAAEQARLAAEAEAARQAAEAAEQARLEADRAERERREAEEAARRQAEEEERRRQEAQAAAAAAEAEARRQAELERQRQEEERKRLEEERKQREAEEAARKAEEERLAAEQAAAAAEAAAEAEAEEADAAAAEAEAQAAAAEADADAAADAAAAPPADDASCDDLTALEPAAMLGKLSEGQLSCLESRLQATSRMTEKKKVSLILMGNAFSKGDRRGWEKLVKRHLDEIDQSDPDLCYKYALHLARKGAGRAPGVIRWANVALENRTVWTGDTYKTRVYSLYKLRAAASQNLWQAAEQEHASAPSEATQDKIKKYRNMTKVNAREWYEYAKVSGKDSSKALQLCMSAAGTADYCEAG